MVKEYKAIDILGKKVIWKDWDGQEYHSECIKITGTHTVMFSMFRGGYNFVSSIEAFNHSIQNDLVYVCENEESVEEEIII